MIEKYAFDFIPIDRPTDRQLQLQFRVALIVAVAALTLEGGVENRGNSERAQGQGGLLHNSSVNQINFAASAIYLC